MSYSNVLREEELKLKVAKDFFSDFDTSPIIGNIDFCVAVAGEQGTLFNMNDADYIESIVWAEAKKGVKSESGMYESLVQLILTIGKARTFDKYLPPSFLASFDAEKIAFIPYEKIMSVFNQNDFNWNVTPSNHETKEFIQLYTSVKEILEGETLAFRFDNDAELKSFIKKNLLLGNRDFNRVSVNKNNFVTVYGKWLNTVQPTINLDWQGVKKYGILDADFFLADLLSADNSTIIEKLFVLLKSNHYELDRKIDEMGFEESKRVSFNDGQKAHKKFWLRYNRPPKEEYWGYIVERRDLLVPQDVRERKGSFFTPQKWVELSQKYIADVLGEDWQDEYYVWDCAAGTGNLLAGLTNKYKIFASTLDKADVEVMKERIANGANLLESHVFQFDFLNDDLQGEKVPESLRKILADENERKKLVIYINPPYAEASNGRTSKGTGENRKDLSKTNTREKYFDIYGSAVNELFAQFLIRIHEEIQCCKLAQFATLKALCAPNFAKFRERFSAKLEKCFLVPANTFDNVTGQFPIGFFVWDLSKKDRFSEIAADCYDSSSVFLQQKRIYSVSKDNIINKWLHTQFDLNNEKIVWLRFVPNDFQNNKGVYITNSPNESDIRESRITCVTKNNLIPVCIYLAVRQCIEATWLNDRDQFLYPNDTWQTDYEFQADCLAFTLFHGQNRITSNFKETPLGDSNTSASQPFSDRKLSNSSLTRVANPRGNSKIEGKNVLEPSSSNNSQFSTINFQLNNWNPFTEAELNAADTFSSHFMSDFINGKLKIENGECELFNSSNTTSIFNSQLSIINLLSPEATAVLDSARELYRYYHATINSQFSTVNSQLLNASFYDIRSYFQGKDANGRMNNASNDTRYNELIADLRAKQKMLAKKIEAKVYEHGFLR